MFNKYFFWMIGNSFIMYESKLSNQSKAGPDFNALPYKKVNILKNVFLRFLPTTTALKLGPDYFAY